MRVIQVRFHKSSKKLENKNASCKTEGGEQVNKRIEEYAETFSDRKLPTKLNAGDIIAQEVKYHPICLVAL